MKKCNEFQKYFCLVIENGKILENNTIKRYNELRSKW